MWIFEVQLGNGDLRQYFLVGGTNYTIGRKDCDILLPTDDPSISRTHAVLTVQPTMAADLTDLRSRPTVLLGDVSKHGTYVNKERLLAVDKKRDIGEGDEMLFGRSITARLHFAPAVVAASSTLSQDEIHDLTLAVCKIGGFLSLHLPFTIDDITQSGLSPFVFLFVTKKVGFEPLAMLAMMNKYCLVNELYLPRLTETIRDACAITLQSLPQPGGFDAVRDPSLATAPYCRPEPCIYGLNQFRTSQHRSHGAEFRMINFVFQDVGLYEAIAHVIKAGGGTSAFVPSSRTHQWQRIETLPDGTRNPRPLRGLTDDVTSHGLNSYVVVPPAMFDHVLSYVTSGEGLQEVDAVERAAYVKLWANDVTLIHRDNLLLAIYSEDTSAHLDPKAPGVLCKAEMTFVDDAKHGDGDCGDNDSNATEDGIHPSTAVLLQQIHSARGGSASPPGLLLHGAAASPQHHHQQSHQLLAMHPRAHQQQTQQQLPTKRELRKGVPVEGMGPGATSFVVSSASSYGSSAAPRQVILAPAEQIFPSSSSRNASAAGRGTSLAVVAAEGESVIRRRAASPSAHGTSRAMEGAATSEALYDSWLNFNNAKGPSPAVNRHDYPPPSSSSVASYRQQRIVARTASPASFSRGTPTGAARAGSPHRPSDAPAASRLLRGGPVPLSASLEERLRSFCAEFSRSLQAMEQQTEGAVAASMRQNFVTPAQRATLETTHQRCTNFKSCLASLLLEQKGNGPLSSLSESALALADRTRAKVDGLSAAVVAAMRQLNISTETKPLPQPSRLLMGSPSSRGNSPARGGSSPATRPRGASPVPAARRASGGASPARRVASPFRA